MKLEAFTDGEGDSAKKAKAQRAQTGPGGGRRRDNQCPGNTTSPPENHERWLVSYADFITLLFAFFVVMFASSQTDKARAKQVSQAVEKALARRTFHQHASGGRQNSGRHGGR